MNPDVIARADELIAAHNEAREQRGKTMTDQSETERQAEQVLSQLTSWVKQQVKANASSQQVIADYKAVMDAQRAEIETLRARPTASSERDSIAALTAATNELNRAMADNAALVEALELYGEHHRDCDWKRTDCTCGLYAIRSTADHPGAALLSELDSVRRERNEALAQTRMAIRMDRNSAVDRKERDAWQRRARAWKAAAKRVKEDRDISVETWGSWHSEAIRLKFQLSEAQQRIAELETAVRSTKEPDNA